MEGEVDRLMARYTDGFNDRQTDNHTDSLDVNSQDGQTDRQADGQTERQTHGLTKAQTVVILTAERGFGGVPDRGDCTGSVARTIAAAAAGRSDARLRLGTFDKIELLVVDALC